MAGTDAIALNDKVVMPNLCEALSKKYTWIKYAPKLYFDKTAARELIFLALYSLYLKKVWTLTASNKTLTEKLL